MGKEQNINKESKNNTKEKKTLKKKFLKPRDV